MSELLTVSDLEFSYPGTQVSSIKGISFGMEQSHEAESLPFFALLQGSKGLNKAQSRYLAITSPLLDLL